MIIRQIFIAQKRHISSNAKIVLRLIYFDAYGIQISKALRDLDRSVILNLFQDPLKYTLPPLIKGIGGKKRGSRNKFGMTL